MESFLALNLLFMAPLAWYTLMRCLGSRERWALWPATGCLLLLTAIFDNLIIASGIVDYNFALTLGLRIGLAPVEDFGYAVAAVMLMASIWTRLHHE
jgi:lycopene cyclase domain-containing protein